MVKTVADLNAEIDTQFPDNHSRSITPATQRTVLKDIVTNVPTTAGQVLTSAGLASATTFLRGDNTWNTPVVRATDIATTSGTPSGTTILYGDNTWRTAPSGGGGSITGGGLGFKFDSRATAITATIPTTGSGGPNWIATDGYADPNDGGDAVYTRVGSAPAYSNLIWFQSADGQYWTMERTNKPLHVEQAGGGISKTGAQNLAAVHALEDFIQYDYVIDPLVGYAYPGPNIQFGFGVYNFSAGWIVHGGSNIRGMGSAHAGGYATRLKFPNNSDGLIFGTNNCDGRTITATNVKQNSASSVVRDLAIVGGWDGSTHPRTAAVPGGPWGIGILIKAPVELDNVYVTLFPEQGIYNCSESGGGDFRSTDEPNMPIEGTGNNFHIMRCTADLNGLDGFKDRGADANAGVYIACTSINNGMWGFNFQNFLGNTIVQGHASTNSQIVTTDPVSGKPVGAYQIWGESQFCTMIGCYSEDDFRPSFIDQFAVSFGGLMAGGKTGTGVQFSAGGVIGPGASVFGRADTITGGAGIAFKTDDGENQYMRFITGTGDPVYLTNDGGCIVWSSGNAAGARDGLAFTSTINSHQAGRGSNIRAGNLIFPKGIFVSGNGTAQDGSDFGSARFIGFMDGLPTAGIFARGDQVWKINPSASASPGWVCTTGGDYAGTPPVWKTMASLGA